MQNVTFTQMKDGTVEEYFFYNNWNTITYESCLTGSWNHCGV